MAQKEQDIGKKEWRGINLVYIVTFCGFLVLSTWQLSTVYNDIKNGLIELNRKQDSTNRVVKQIVDLQNIGKLK